MSRKGARARPALSEEQINEILANYDLECAYFLDCGIAHAGEKLLARLERGAQRCIEAARTQMEARTHKIPPDVRNGTLQAYYDMHPATAAAEHGRQLPPLAMASLPDGTE